MRFLTVYTPAADNRQMPHPDDNAAMARLVEQMTKDGTLVTTGGVGPNPHLAKVTNKRGKIAVLDGPFSEAKELIGGFAILEARDLAHATELARQFISIAGEGECEIFSVFMDFDGPAPSP
jgi:hypothetical protein